MSPSVPFGHTSGMAVPNSFEVTLCQALRTHKRHFVCSWRRIWGARSSHLGGLSEYGNTAG
jgi:hypothetical protein